MLTAFCLFATFFFLYLNVSCHLRPYTFATNDAVFSADSRWHSRDLTREFDWSYFEPGKDLGQKRHLLYLPTASLLFSVVKSVLPFLSNDQIVSTCMALLGAVIVLMGYRALLLFTKSPMTAGLFAVFHGVTVSALVMFSVPDTYALSCLSILIYFNVLMSFKDDLRFTQTLILSVCVALAGLFNPALMTLVTIHLYLILQKFGYRRLVRYGCANLAVAFALFAIPNTLFVGSYFEFAVQVSGSWGSLSNFMSPTSYAKTFLGPSGFAAGERGRGGSAQQVGS